MDRLDLAVIESRWWNKSNDSVRGLFDVLAGIHVDNPFGYHYEMFNTGDSLKELIPRIVRQRHIRHLYIAAHGDNTSIYGAGTQNKISRAVLSHILEKVRPRQLRGLFFGSCKFGLQTEALMARTGIAWIAGYTKEIDWIHSTLMDLLFWDAYYKSTVSSVTLGELPEHMLKFLAVLHVRVPYVFGDLGLRVTFGNGDGYATFPDGCSSELLDKILEDVTDDLPPGTWP